MQFANILFKAASLIAVLAVGATAAPGNSPSEIFGRADAAACVQPGNLCISGQGQCCAGYYCCGGANGGQVGTINTCVNHNC